MDTDRLIEQEQGQTIAQIFASSGEEVFRNMESRLLDRLFGDAKVPGAAAAASAAVASTKGLVIATGGGICVRAENLLILEENAVLVYLTAPLEVLVTRIKQSEKRPMLTGSDDSSAEQREIELSQRLGKLIAEREQIYSRARYKIDTSAGSPEKSADEIIRLAGLADRPV